MQVNADEQVVTGFGEEWARFDQSVDAEGDLSGQFEAYFSIFPWDKLPSEAQGFDAGCGSGRWARFVAPRVGTLHAVDASSEALAVAQKNLNSLTNVEFHHSSVAQMPFDDASQDFGYSLGVLHHIPDTQGGLNACVRKLKPGAPFLVYLYYRLDGRPQIFHALWQCSDLLRRILSRSPRPIRFAASELIAATIYFPLARVSRLFEKFGRDVKHVPLSFYRDKSFYMMRTDALDRFGTRLEQRFDREQIVQMMQLAGLERIQFREAEPYWCALGYKI